MKNPIKERRERKRKKEQEHKEFYNDIHRRLQESQRKFQDTMREINKKEAQRKCDVQQAILDIRDKLCGEKEQ